MIPDPKVGTRCQVTVSRGHGDDYKIYPSVPCDVVYITWTGKNKRHAGGPMLVVKLLEDAAPGWYKGDTYRTDVDHLYPEGGIPYEVQPPGTYVSNDRGP